jgi:recombinational DNA repair protein RecR
MHKERPREMLDIVESCKDVKNLEGTTKFESNIDFLILFK